MGAGGIDLPSVIADLNFAGDLAAIRITSMQQQLACAQPTRIKVREIAAGNVVLGGLASLVRDQNEIGVAPGAGCCHEREKQSELRLGWQIMGANPQYLG